MQSRIIVGMNFVSLRVFIIFFVLLQWHVLHYGVCELEVWELCHVNSTAAAVRLRHLLQFHVEGVEGLLAGVGHGAASGCLLLGVILHLVGEQLLDGVCCRLGGDDGGGGEVP